MYKIIRHSLSICFLFAMVTGLAAQPVANFYFFNPVCKAVPTTFFNSTNPAPTWPNPYQWTFPGGSPATSTATNPVVTFNVAGTYACTLRVFLPSGSLVSQLIQSVQVLPGPDGDFTSTTNGQEISFDFNGTNIYDADWEFGDGAISDPLSNDPFLQINHLYNTPGIYTVKATAHGPCGNIVRTHTVFTEFVPDFEVSEPITCTGTSLTLNNTSTFKTGVSWLWEFPGGIPATSTNEQPASLKYNQPGVYTVKLTAFLPGTSFTETKIAYISVKEPPAASFNYMIDGQTVMFEDSSQNATGYIWDFGDGAASFDINPVHEYLEDGVYTVSLYAQNECGEAVSEEQVTIATLPKAFFEISSIVDNCGSFMVTTAATLSGNTDNFEFRFPGGTPGISTTNPATAIYPAGNFVIQLIARNETGTDTFSQAIHLVPTQLPTAKVRLERISGSNFQFSALNPGATTTYSWSFGDGGPSGAGTFINHDFAANKLYKVTLNASNNCYSVKDSLWVSTFWPSDNGFLPAAQNLDSCPPALWLLQMPRFAQPDSLRWWIPGAVPSTTTQWNPVISLLTPGNYPVTLVVYSGSDRDTFYQQNALSAFGQPVAGFNYTSLGRTFFFQNTTAGSGNSGTFFWNFGDGGFSSTPNPIRDYQQAGVYTVTLIAGGTCGYDTMSQQVTVTDPGSAPEASFLITNSGNNGCAPATTGFLSTSSGAASVQWFFENGNPATSDLPNPQVVFSSAGVFQVTFIAANSFGYDTVYQSITVGSPPQAFFTAHLQTPTYNTYLFDASPAPGTATYHWDFGDGQFGNGQSVTHSFNQTGAFTVTLVVENDCAADTFLTSQILAVIPPPPANCTAQVLPANACVPATFSFTHDATSPLIMQWSFENGSPGTSFNNPATTTWTATGVYNIQLQAMNPLNVLEPFELCSLTVETFDLEMIDFQYVVNQESVTFDGQFSNGSALWDFGDGSTSTQSDPTHTYPVSGAYTVRLSVTNSCGTAVLEKVVTVMVLSTDENAEFPFLRIFPNPNNGHFYIELEAGIAPEPVLLVLENSVGQSVLTQIADFSSGTPVEITGGARLSAGVYLLRLQMGTQMTTRRIMVH